MLRRFVPSLLQLQEARHHDRGRDGSQNEAEKETPQPRETQDQVRCHPYHERLHQTGAKSKKEDGNWKSRK